MYKSARNLGFEITCLHKVNKGKVTTLLCLHHFLTQRVLVPYKNLICLYTVYCFVTAHIIVVFHSSFNNNNQVNSQTNCCDTQQRSSGRTHSFGPIPPSLPTRRIQTEILEAIRFTTRTSKPDSLVHERLTARAVSLLSFFKWRQRCYSQHLQYH